MDTYIQILHLYHQENTNQGLHLLAFYDKQTNIIL